LRELVEPALAERLTLLVNHVISGEASAMQRLQAHAGRTVSFSTTGWPQVLPPVPVLAWRITPPGLLEWCGPQAVTDMHDLSVRVDASNPALLLLRGLAGDQPALQIEGDAALAGDVSWLVQNLRWDIAGDLEKLLGPVPARQLHQLGLALSSALRAAVKGAAGLGDRLRPRRE
jgi:ubiquinone biosynthesis protein UbiJ